MPMGVSAMRGRVALPAAEGQTLAADAAQLAQIIKPAVLPAETERAGGHHHGFFIRTPASTTD